MIAMQFLLFPVDSHRSSLQGFCCLVDYTVGLEKKNSFICKYNLKAANIQAATKTEGMYMKTNGLVVARNS